MVMRALGLLALATCSACAPAQTADPAPVLASQSDLAQIRHATRPCLMKTWTPPAKGRAARVTLKWRLD